MLYLPSFRRSAHQADAPAPSYSFRPYTPEPIPAPAPLNHHTSNLNINAYTNTNATPHNNGTAFTPPYSSPHFTSATPKPPQSILARLTQNAHYALLTLSVVTFATAITTIGLAADTLHQYRAAQSVPHHLRLLPPNIDTAPTVAVLGSAALVAILNMTFIIVSVLQTTQQRRDQAASTPLLALLTSLSTLPFTLFATTYYHLHAFTLPPSSLYFPSPSSSSSSPYGPALSARGVPPAPVPSAIMEGRAYAGLSSPGATSTASASASAVAGLQGWACRIGSGGMSDLGRICGEGRALGGLVAVLVAVCVLGVVGGGVGVWVGRRKSRVGMERLGGREGVGKGREEVEGGWL